MAYPSVHPCSIAQRTILTLFLINYPCAASLQGTKVKTTHLKYWRKIRGFSNMSAESYKFDKDDGDPPSLTSHSSDYLIDCFYD